ncbi:MAG: diguanylate cyclase [Actinomycetota bacterium]
MAEKIKCRGMDIDIGLLAEEILETQTKFQPELKQKYSKKDFEVCKRDISYHINYLCQALSCDSLPLFLDYVNWATVMLTEHGVPVSDFVNNLESMIKVFRQRLPNVLRTMAINYIKEAIRAVKEDRAKAETFISPANKYYNLAKNYLNAILEGEKEKASYFVSEALKEEARLEDIYLYVFQPSQYELGRLWQLGKIDVATEHYGTAITHSIMAQLYPRILSSEKMGLKFLGACINGEQHEIGIRMLADLLELKGWDTYYLGSNTPPGSMVKKIKEREIDLVGISATMTYNLGNVDALIKKIRSEARDVKIMVGGYPFRVDENLWKAIGADGYGKDAGQASWQAATLVKKSKTSKKTKASRSFAGSSKTEVQNKKRLYSKLADINNELLTAQRELEKKNIELEKLNKKLEEMAIRDPLTSLYNRRFFYQKIEEEINRARRLNYGMVVAMADINNFKQVNDSHGHEEGDKVLKKFASIVENNLRKGMDSAYRWGGDEFLILLVDSNLEKAEKVLKRLDSNLRSYLQEVSLSYGFEKISRLEKVDMEKIIKNVDNKMYEHKKKQKKI